MRTVVMRLVTTVVDLLDPTSGPLRPEPGRPGAIYAAGANDDGEGVRCRETVAPLAGQLGVTVSTTFGKGDEEKLVEHVLGRPGPALIPWQHEEISSIAAANSSRADCADTKPPPAH